MSKVPYEIALLKTDDPVQTDQDFGELMLQPYQYLTKFMIYPGSDKYRTLIKHGTGLGKTIEALSVAQNFIRRGRRVFILTFNETIFINDMLKFPQLGFISFATKEKLLLANADQADLARKQAKKEALKNVKIFGYKEFQNMFFWTEGQQQKINLELLQYLYDSVLICDEIHDVYNSDQQNTWGKTIQMVSSILQANIYIVLMSATPLNNPEEIDDLINLMVVENTENRKWAYIREAASAISIQSVDDIKHPVPMTEEQVPMYIHKYMKNRISFVPESQQQMPRQIFKGVVYESIANIQLVPCIHSEEFKKYYTQTPNYLHDEEWRKHICFNFPTPMKLDQFMYELKKKTPAVLQWSREIGIQVEHRDGRDWILGNFLRYHTIGRYSPKFEQLLSLLMQAEGKSFIYINGVKNVGVDLIASLLKTNGIIGERDIPSQDTVCFLCRNRLKDHTLGTRTSTETSEQDMHKFIPYRFITITGKSKSDNDKNMQLFNDPNNLTGQNIQIVIGSKIIKQGFNILATNNTFVLSLPFNVPNLLQVLGRNARTKSHANLPPEKQYVNIYILVTASTEGHIKSKDAYEDLTQTELQSENYGQITREELEYFNKFNRFAKIQQYEKIMHEVAIDPEIYGKLYFLQEASKDDLLFYLPSSLKMLPFRPQQQYIEGKIGDYDMRNYYKQKIHRDLFDMLDVVVGAKFREQTIWDIESLIQAVVETKIVPNPKKVKKQDVYFAILNHENTHTLGKYIIKTAHTLDIDWFLPQTQSSQIKRLQLATRKQKSIAAELLSKFLETNFPVYCQQIDALRVRSGKINLTNTQAKELRELLLDGIPKMSMGEFENIMMSAFDQRDINLLRVLFLVTVPIKKGDLFSVPEEETNDIIGFLSNNKSIANIKQEEGWTKVRLQRQFIEFESILCILARKGFKIIQRGENVRKEKDKRYEFQGIVCETMGKKDVAEIATHFGLRQKSQKTQLCSSIKDHVTQMELQARLSMLQKKILFFDFA